MFQPFFSGTGCHELSYLALIGTFACGVRHDFKTRSGQQLAGQLWRPEEIQRIIVEIVLQHDCMVGERKLKVDMDNSQFLRDRDIDGSLEETGIAVTGSSN